MNPSLQSPVSSLQSNSDVLVRVEGVSKKFCLSLKKSLWYGLQDMGRELTGRRRGGVDGRRQTVDGRLETRDGRLETAAESLQSTVRSPQSNSLGLRPKEFWAVNNVSFELKRGECLGLIGRNGAGKTTLLKMLNGLIKPDAGRIEMRGRVGALIALGAGFNPILTGRENIYVNASVLGLSKKETDAKLDEIIDFAEIGDFIDTPVQNYSSGMAVRLGFAIASTLEPDILLADEILAVGDAGFRAKCYRKFSALLDKGVSVIFVSHEIANIQVVCNKCLWLKSGQVADYGEVMPVTSAYTIWLDQNAPKDISAVRGPEGPNRLSGAKILDVYAVDEAGQRTESVETGNDLRIRIEYEVISPIDSLSISVSLRTKEEALYNAYSTHRDGVGVNPVIGKSHVDLVLPELGLGAGEFWVSIGLGDSKGFGFYDWNWTATHIQIMTKTPLIGRFMLPHHWEMAH